MHVDFCLVIPADRQEDDSFLNIWRVLDQALQEDESKQLYNLRCRRPKRCRQVTLSFSRLSPSYPRSQGSAGASPSHLWATALKHPFTSQQSKQHRDHILTLPPEDNLELQISPKMPFSDKNQSTLRKKSMQAQRERM